MTSDPTPRDGYPAQPGLDSVRRRARLVGAHTPAEGVEVIVVDRPSGRAYQRPTSDSEVDGLNAIVDARIRRAGRKWKGVLLTLAVAVVGSIGGVIAAHGNSRAAAERVLTRIEALESAEKQRQEDERVERTRQRNELLRLQAPWPAAPTAPPAPKEPQP